MRRAMNCIVAFGVLLACPVVVAEEQQSEGEKLLQKWGEQTVGGVWTLVDGNQEGAYTWVLNKKFLQLKLKTGRSEWIAYYGVDPETDKIRGWGFRNDGLISEGSLTPDGEGWLQEVKNPPPEAAIFWRQMI